MIKDTVDNPVCPKVKWGSTSRLGPDAVISVVSCYDLFLYLVGIHPKSYQTSGLHSQNIVNIFLIYKYIFFFIKLVSLFRILQNLYIDQL